MNNTNKPFILPVLGVGFSIWLLATIAFRVAGQYFFITESPVVFSLLYLIVIPALSIISILTFKRFKLSGVNQIIAGVLMVLPGMLIDTFVIPFFDVVFPNMPASRAAAFGSWLMWAYSIVLLTAIITGLKQNKTPA